MVQTLFRSTFPLMVAGLAPQVRTASTAPEDGKPRTGGITIGSGNNSPDPNDSNGWYLDPSPSDWAEFDGTILNAFAGRSTANLGFDLYSVASLELTHVLGLISDKNNDGTGFNGYRLESSGFATNTGIRDNAEGGGSFGHFWVFDGPTVDHLMTSYNSGDPTSASWGNIIHTAGGGGNINFNNTNWRSAEDPGNAIYLSNERTMPSWVTAHILADAYQYSIKDPESFGSMYASLNNSTGVLTVRGGVNNSVDAITVSSYSLVGTQFLEVAVDVGNDVPGTRHLPGVGNLPPWTSTFFGTNVSSIVINSGDGQDFIRIEGNAGIPVTVNAGDGDDFIDFSFFARDLGNISASTVVNGGAGFDNIFVYDNNNANPLTYSVTDARFDRGGWGGFFYAADIEALALTTGSGGDTVNVMSTYAGQPVVLNSAGGADVVNIGNSFNGVQTILADVQIQNDPAFTTVNISDVGNSVPRNVIVDQWAGNFGAMAGLAPAYIVWDNLDIQEIHVTTGSGADDLSILRSSERMYFSNANGVDQVTIGNNVNGVAEITGAIDVGPNAPFVLTDLVINDAAAVFGKSFGWVPDGNGFFLTGLPAGLRFENARGMEVLAGSGNDQFTLIGITKSVTVDGGVGFDTLWVDDRTMPYDVVLSGVYADRFERLSGGIFAVGPTTYFSNIEAPTFYLDETSTDNTIHGTSSAIPAGSQFTLLGGPNDDSFTVIPRDANGNPSILGAMGIIGGGGVDSMIVDDAASATGTDWFIDNYFGSGTQNFVVGAGTYFGSAEVENISLSGSAGDDQFYLDRYQSGTSLQVFGNGGSDRLDVTPTTSDVSAGITSIAYFNFDGGDGYDQFFVPNDNGPGGWDYVRTVDYFQTIGPFYSLTMHNVNVEYMYATGGVNNDRYFVNAIPAETVTAFDGGDGVNHYEIGNGGLTDGIQGGVQLYPTLGFNSFTIDDHLDPLGRTVHVDIDNIGAVPGDDLFGPGGYLTYGNFSGPITVKLGTGSDTAYVVPHPYTPIVIEDPNPMLESTDFLGLAFATASNPVFVANGPDAGTYTFDNAASLTYSGMEMSVVDNTAPQVLSAQFIQSPVHSVLFQFDEDISQILQAADLVLTDTLTGLPIAAAAIELSYDSNTNTATFTFPGLSGGQLPVGDYMATLNARVSDLYGNHLMPFAPLTITVSSTTPDGDFNDDGLYDLLDIDALVGVIAAQSHNPLFDLTQDGLVDLADRDAWLAEAGGINLGPGRVYRLGDANLDGVVDGQDFILWNSNKFTATNQWSLGDFNADGVVDGQDFILWNSNKFTSAQRPVLLHGATRIVERKLAANS